MAILIRVHECFSGVKSDVCWVILLYLRTERITCSVKAYEVFDCDYIKRLQNRLRGLSALRIRIPSVVALRSFSRRAVSSLNFSIIGGLKNIFISGCSGYVIPIFSVVFFSISIFAPINDYNEYTCKIIDVQCSAVAPPRGRFGCPYRIFKFVRNRGKFGKPPLMFDNNYYKNIIWHLRTVSGAFRKKNCDTVPLGKIPGCAIYYYVRQLIFTSICRCSSAISFFAISRVFCNFTFKLCHSISLTLDHDSGTGNGSKYGDG